MANDPQTYAELLASVATWLNRADLTDKVPEFIAFAERRFNRVLNVPEQDVEGTLAAAATVALPADLWQVRALYLDTDPRQPLEQVTLSVLRGRYAAQTTGRPQVYALSAGDIILGPAPDSAYDMILTYKQTIPPLSVSNTTNWLLTAHPDIYLFGTLLQAEAYLFNDNRLDLWKTALDEALGELMQSGNRKRHGGAPLRLRAPVAW